MTDRYVTYLAVLRVPEHFDTAELDEVTMPAGVEVMFDSSREYVAGEFGDYGFDVPEDVACVRCGRTPAEGWAGYGSQRLCHGNGLQPTCYEIGTTQNHNQAMWTHAVRTWANQRRLGLPLRP